jgi:hypothetical protein
MNEIKNQFSSIDAHQSFATFMSSWSHVPLHELLFFSKVQYAIGMNSSLYE